MVVLWKNDLGDDAWMLEESLLHRRTGSSDLVGCCRGSARGSEVIRVVVADGSWRQVVATVCCLHPPALHLCRLDTVVNHIMGLRPHPCRAWPYCI